MGRELRGEKGSAFSVIEHLALVPALIPPPEGLPVRFHKEEASGAGCHARIVCQTRR